MVKMLPCSNAISRGDTPVVFLRGARQSGKSTLVKEFARTSFNAGYITLDNATMLSSRRAAPILKGRQACIEGNRRGNWREKTERRHCYLVLSVNAIGQLKMTRDNSRNFSPSGGFKGGCLTF